MWLLRYLSVGVDCKFVVMGYSGGMEFTDYMVWKLVIFASLAFIWGLIFAKRK